MKKSILIVLLVAFLAIAVGVSGCLNSGDDNSTDNNTTNNSTPAPSFNGSIVTIDPVPAGYELLAVKNVTADSENIDGINDALIGFVGYYAKGSSNVYLSVFQTESNKSAEGYVQSMIDAHKEKYPQSNNVTTVTINGHDATLITETTTAGGSTVERYTLAWANGSNLVVLNGPATYGEIKTIAEASKL
ncbi:DUF4367 domain-containing protein [Methanimicrococcus sp. OttesenSCG-928-J09]|nr:DUF4367 domain-containing protein [Methanimicrococcus sp. OttesenSCG-928-J09]